MTKHQLIEEAMRLPPEDRRDVVEVLSVTLDWDEDDTLSPEVIAELDRRLEDHLRNPESGSTWDEVKARLGYHP